MLHPCCGAALPPAFTWGKTTHCAWSAMLPCTHCMPCNTCHNQQTRLLCASVCYTCRPSCLNTLPCNISTGTTGAAAPLSSCPRTQAPSLPSKTPPPALSPCPSHLARRPCHEEVAAAADCNIVAARAAGDVGEAALVVGGAADACRAAGSTGGQQLSQP